MNDVQPAEIGRHEDTEPGKTGTTRRILPEAGANLQHHEDDDIGVHDVVQPAGKKNVPERLKKSEPLVCSIPHHPYPGKTASRAFGKTSSRSMAINVQKVTPTFSATGKANAASV